MASFYTNTASFDNLEVSSSLTFTSTVPINFGTSTSKFSGSFSGSFQGSGTSLNNIKIPVFKTTTDSPAITGTVAITLATQSFIPANTFVADEIIEIKARTRKTGTAGTHAQRWYTNTTASLSGATLICTYIAAATNVSLQIIRQIAIKTSTSSEIFASGISTITDDTTNANAVTTIATNWGVDQYILFSIQNGNNADSSRYSFYKIMPL